jgi:hypothetical protein
MPEQKLLRLLASVEGLTAEPSPVADDIALFYRDGSSRISITTTSWTCD